MSYEPKRSVTINEDGKRIYKYLRVCKCGNESWVGYKPKEGTPCRRCSASELGYKMSQNNIKIEADKTKYKHICIDCNAVRWLTRKVFNGIQGRCGKCSRSFIGRSNRTEGDVSLPAKELYRVCQDCGDRKLVNNIAGTKAKRCMVCAKKNMDRAKITKAMVATVKRTSKPVVVKKKKVVKKKVVKPPVMTEANLERVREMNRRHKIAVKDKPKKIVHRLTDEEMIAKFLETNEVTVGDTPVSFEWSGTMKDISSLSGRII